MQLTQTKRNVKVTRTSRCSNSSRNWSQLEFKNSYTQKNMEIGKENKMAIVEKEQYQHNGKGTATLVDKR